MNVRRTFVLALGAIGIAAALPGCGGSSSDSSAQAAEQRQANMWQIDQIEVTWHRASSTQDVDLMMSLWAEDATFTYRPLTISRARASSGPSSHDAGPFQPRTLGIPDTPAYKIRTR